MELPVIVKFDVGDETWIMDAAVATKQGHSFRIYPDTTTVQVIRADGTAETMTVAQAAAAYRG